MYTEGLRVLTVIDGAKYKQMVSLFLRDYGKLFNFLYSKGIIK